MPGAFSEALNYAQRQQQQQEQIQSRQQLYWQQMQERQRLEQEREWMRWYLMKNSPAQQRANLLQQKYEQQQKFEDADRTALLALDPKDVPVDLRGQLNWAKQHPTPDVVKRMFMMLGKFNPKYIQIDTPDPSDPTIVRHSVIRTDMSGGLTGVPSSPGLAGLTGGGTSPATRHAGGGGGISPPAAPSAPPPPPPATVEAPTYAPGAPDFYNKYKVPSP